MKLLQSKTFLAITIIVLLLGYAVSCTKNDRVITVGETTINESELVSVKVTTPPAIDGVIDGMWANSPKLQFSTAVPEVTGDVFRGYNGNIIPSVTLRSAYDATNIYFLAEWLDPTQSLTRLPW